MGDADCLRVLSNQLDGWCKVNNTELSQLNHIWNIEEKIYLYRSWKSTISLTGKYRAEMQWKERASKMGIV